MPDGWVALDKDSREGWRLHGRAIELQIILDDDGWPTIGRLASSDASGAGWASGAVLGPTLVGAGRRYEPGGTGMDFLGGEVDTGGRQLRLRYRCANGLDVCHVLCPSPHKAVVRLWTKVSNLTDQVIGGLTRFDTLGMALGTSAAQPAVAYLLGWLWDPRADAPGHHTLPYPYPSWIPRLIYGDDAPPPPRIRGANPFQHYLDGMRRNSISR